MLALPGKKDVTASELLDEEVKRQLEIMKANNVESDEYKQAIKRYEELHEQQLKELQLKENRRARWFDALVTGGLAGLTLTAEQWTPLTSKWFTSLMHPFRSKRTDLF